MTLGALVLHYGMRNWTAIGLALLIAVGFAPPRTDAGSLPDDDEQLRGTPIDGAFTLTIRLPKCDSGADGDDRSCGRVITVPGVVTGQRVPLPTKPDGSCPRHVRTELSSDIPLRVEFEPEGCQKDTAQICTHFIQHAIGTETSEHVDSDRCEVVIDEAIARDDVHRKRVRRLTPLQRDHFFGQPPSPADMEGSKPRKPLPGFEE